MSRSVLTHLRSVGKTVLTGDVELYGSRRYLTAAKTAAWPRRRWWVRYHLGSAGFEARTEVANRLVLNSGEDVDVLFQVGATFQADERPEIPRVLYCDSTITMSKRGASTGYSEASTLSKIEYQKILAREEEVYRHAKLIFCMSDLLKRTFIEDFGIPAHRLVTVHCAPNTTLPEPKSQVGRPDQPPTVLFVGRDWGRKGGDVLMDAFPLVRKRVPEARLRVVGSRPPGALPEWLECVGAQSRDTEKGSRRMDEVYRTSDVFCLASRFEPFGTSFVEAMAYELPCVGPKAWAVPEIIEHERTGLLFEPESPSALAQALVTVLSDPARRSRMGRAGRRRMLGRFTWPRIANKISVGLEAVVASSAASNQAGV